ncbi:uncharacterized protein LOC110837721 [Zootermopsis nevadensis]|uniref:uncharacterized protein LOC110837721 n=1 Tax=Zootermopsis nevadensis TaxID=136037 RepID=UPI000B8E3EB6|nr:uncharacterized protein LOC110837721 [Zootermopsis nevadensis]
MRYSDLMTRRHDAVVSRVRKAAEGKFTIITENEAVQGHLRPVLIIAKDNKAMIIDITIPFENRMEAIKEARTRKIEKYQDLARALSGRVEDVKVDAIVLGSLGSWDPENDKVMKTMSSRAG